jgi:hypothetical protein
MNYINTDAVIRCNCPVATDHLNPWYPTLPSTTIVYSGCSRVPAISIVREIVSPAFNGVFALTNGFQDPKGHIFCHFYSSTIPHHHR